MYQIRRIERRTAVFTLIPIGFLVSAFRTGAHYETVGQKLSGFGVVELFADFLDKVPLLIERFEKLRSGFVMNLRRGSGIVIEGNSKFPE